MTVNVSPLHHHTCICTCGILDRFLYLSFLYADSEIVAPIMRCLFAKESAAVYLARFFGRVKYTIG